MLSPRLMSNPDKIGFLIPAFGGPLHGKEIEFDSEFIEDGITVVVRRVTGGNEKYLAVGGKAYHYAGLMRRARDYLNENQDIIYVCHEFKFIEGKDVCTKYIGLILVGTLEQEKIPNPAYKWYLLEFEDFYFERKQYYIKASEAVEAYHRLYGSTMADILNKATVFYHSLELINLSKSIFESSFLSALKAAERILDE